MFRFILEIRPNKKDIFQNKENVLFIILLAVNRKRAQ